MLSCRHPFKPTPQRAAGRPRVEVAPYQLVATTKDAIARLLETHGEADAIIAAPITRAPEHARPPSCVSTSTRRPECLKLGFNQPHYFHVGGTYGLVAEDFFDA